MRVIIDTNCLQSEELWAFLAMTPDNKAVLPDYVVMEAFKPRRWDGLRAAFSVLSKFPRQVIALHGSAAVSVLNPDAVVMTDAMISQNETEAFRTFSEQIKAAEQDPHIAAELHQRANWAQEQMDRMLAAWSDMETTIAAVSQCFTPRELANMRRNTPTAEAFGKFIGLVESMTIEVFNQKPDLVRPNPERLVDHFVFRNALCLTVLMTEHMRKGARTRKAERARNDAIDVLLAAYGTYFDGIMSEDRLTNETFHIGRDLLRSWGANVGGHYLEYFGAPPCRLKEASTAPHSAPD
jgi:hypothetical protein